MAKLYIELPDKEFVLLAQDANNSCRSPRDQARWLLRQALGIAEQPSTDKTQNDAGRIREGSLASAVL